MHTIKAAYYDQLFHIEMTAATAQQRFDYTSHRPTIYEQLVQIL